MRKRIVNLTRINHLPRFKKISSVIYITLLTGLIVLGMAACKGASGSDLNLTSGTHSTIDTTATIGSNQGTASGTTIVDSKQPAASTAVNSSLKGKDNPDTKDTQSEKEMLFYYNRYFGPIDVPTSILSKSWDSPEQVDAQEIFMFFIANSGENRGLSLMDGKQLKSFFDKAEKTYKFPASIYEPIVQKYFNTSSEHLKTAQFYNKISNTYDIKMVSGFGGGRNYKVKEVSVVGTAAAITVVYYNEKNKPTQTTTLTVRDKGNSFEYISCKVTKNQ